MCRVKTILSAIDYLQLSGIQVVAGNLQATYRIDQVDFLTPSAIVLGSEGKGVSPAILTKVNQQFIIPQIGTTNSFNVSVAAGIVLYEAIRQRLKV